ncbi:MAG: hypoxanthine phosphoribosyltransferase [Sphaerochaetaceae bacterium]|nr:hypoxanthine phosphoribosyltransferase [Spirochaetales bacterium]MDY3768184.1 hypoxanthine phosphoribosyltransferase [Sphaerochaetaceae bacterium]MDY5968013.1 hypoxanthine phosphoribosyltransferase [Sphaerochaetaceae bacterium]
MNNNALPRGIKRILFSRDEISNRIKELAHQIDEDFKDAKEPIILVGVLKGSFIFLSDLSRELTIPHIIDFIAVSSYGKKKTTKSSGSVRMIMDTREDQQNRDVLIVEDILDSGYTLEYINKMFIARGTHSVKNVVLLTKEIKHEADVKLDYLGFSSPDVWAVGYGLDYRERFRTLPYIAELDIDLIHKEEN